jgi:hypothetical protein
MKKGCIALSVLLLLPLVAYAGGGGGIEYLTNPGPEIMNALNLPSGSLASLPTGTVNSVSLFGYGITRGGWKIGGFGSFFYTLPIDMTIPEFGYKVTGAAGGFGDIISGGYQRIGPLTLALNLRLGAGGMGIRYVWTDQGQNPFPSSVGTFILHGAVDGELGIILVPAMMVSVFAGVDAIVAMPAFVPVPVPDIGVRVTWGKF